jgi:hypothetical protein
MNTFILIGRYPLLLLSNVGQLLMVSRYYSLLHKKDNQFGFRHKHSMTFVRLHCKKLWNSYVSMNNPVYICYLDTLKPFDHVSHWSLIDKLLNNSLPKPIVNWSCSGTPCQLLLFSWELHFSCPFTVVCGVLQGGIISPFF